MKVNARDQYFLILADIATVAAIGVHDRGYAFTAGDGEYIPGSLRDRWLAGTSDAGLRKRVMAMASAGAASLQGMTEQELVAAAGKYGVTLSAVMAQRIAEYFDAKRNAVLTYNK